MRRVAVINVVGLTRSLIGPHTPNIMAWQAEGRLAAIRPAFPAVTCTAQATYVSGVTASAHGIVGNGWYNRELAEVQFWKQSNHLVTAPKVWDQLRRPGFTCAKVFWWYNMYSTADFSITPRPIYPADGRKVFDIYTHPATVRTEIKRDLGEFPFPCFWGPAAGVDSPQGPPEAVSRWIAEAAKWFENRYQPTLNLVYLPHLDYNLQRLGPQHPEIRADLRRIDAIVGDLINYFRERHIGVILLSEYGITAVDRPIHLNRLFREQGWLATREELGRELLDAGASKVFAVADHQVAHIYLNDCSLERPARELIEAASGVDAVLSREEKRAHGIDHPRAGDLVALSEQDAWFTYYYWLDDQVAPDFARCVDIHRKPGYDPVELFMDPRLPAPKLKVAWRLLQKKLGFRMLMDVVPLDATLVKGSHGICPADEAEYPVLIAGEASWLKADRLDATAVCGLIRDAVLSNPPG